MSYNVRGRTAATTANADHAVFGVWNPHSTQRIKLIQWSIFKEGAGTAADGLRIRRTSARGTVGSSVTAGIEHHSERAIAAPSIFTLDLAAYSAQPTLVGSSEIGNGWVAAAFAAAGIVAAVPGGIIIPPGTGLAWCQTKATIWPISEVSVVVLEDW